MVTDIEIYCEALKVLKFLVTSTVNNLAVIEINNSTNKHEQNDRKSRIEKPPLINEPSISLILSNMQSLTKKVNSCDSIINYKVPESLPSSDSNEIPVTNQITSDKPNSKEDSNIHTETTATVAEAQEEVYQTVIEEFETGDQTVSELSLVEQQNTNELDILIDLENKLNYRSLRFFSYRPNYTPDMQATRTIPISLLKSFLVKLHEFNLPTNLSVMLRPTQHVSIIFRLDLIAQFTMYSLIQRLIKNHYTKMRQKKKKIKRSCKVAKYLFNKDLRLIIANSFCVPALPESMTSNIFFTASKWFRDTTLVQFKEEIMNTNKSEVNASKNTSNCDKPIIFIENSKPKLVETIKPNEIVNQKKITDYFNVSKKEIRFVIPKQVEEREDDEKLLKRYHAFNFMEPTQFYDPTQQFNADGFDQIKVDSFSENEEIVLTQIIPSGQQLETKSSHSSIESFSSFNQMESIQISPPESQSSGETTLDINKKSKPEFLVPDTIFMDFKPIKYEPQKPKLVFISPSQVSQFAMSSTQQQQPTQSQFVSEQAPNENSRKSVKRRKSMRTGLSKVQRIREPLHVRSNN